MSATDSAEPKVDDLEREVDASRAQVSHTLDELQSQVSDTLDQWRSRLTAEEITKELKRYASDYVSSLGDRMATRAREHPASAVAIGAAAAWPVYKLVRNIPLSVYLMGAGVALMKPLNRAWEHGRDAFTDLTPPRQEPGSARYREVVQGTGTRADERTAAGGGGLSGAAGRAGESVRGAMHHAYEAAAGMTSDLPGRASAVASRAAAMSRQAGGNPLLLGALGLAASAAVAAALPRSRPRPARRSPDLPGPHGARSAPSDSARAAVLRAYGAARREALDSGASPAQADTIARTFILRMGGRGEQAPARYDFRGAKPRVRSRRPAAVRRGIDDQAG